eukprot:CAMPEP_0116914674 /NCGR_PEP_ID=MMETSP0467-20121206/17473_1 /TAXON_ID=283647 /ORGANISM="Mesodinium pulex, Strain SPMC105" /LENGTH=200 /DNA_ID=CAMNT_0004591191 /DNA_START=125 /DNA_END=728 /DNA_ORIENTATION=+
MRLSTRTLPYQTARLPARFLKELVAVGHLDLLLFPDSAGHCEESPNLLTNKRTAGLGTVEPGPGAECLRIASLSARLPKLPGVGSAAANVAIVQLAPDLGGSLPGPAGLDAGYSAAVRELVPAGDAGAARSDLPHAAELAGSQCRVPRQAELAVHGNAEDLPRHQEPDDRELHHHRDKQDADQQAVAVVEVGYGHDHQPD